MVNIVEIHVQARIQHSQFRLRVCISKLDFPLLFYNKRLICR